MSALDPTVPPVAAIPPEPAVAAAPAVNPGPWAADLAARFPDEAQRAAVDAYMREVVQPGRTQLETQLAELKPAGELYNDFVEDSQGTLAAIVGELYPHLAEKFTGLFSASEDVPPPVTPVTPAAPTALELAAMPPEVREIVAREQAAADTKVYNDTIDEWIEGHADLTPEDRDHVHAYVSSAGGDLTVAAANYIARRTALEARYKPADPAVPVVPATPPPATLDGNGATSTAPPVARKETLDEALDGWLAESKTAPTTVGTV